MKLGKYSWKAMSIYFLSALMSIAFIDLLVSF